MKSFFNKMMRNQIEADLNNPEKLLRKPIPKVGWIKTIRKILGMTSSQLAKRLGCSQSNIIALEKREKEKTISLDALENTAQQMHCKLVYFFIPEKSFDEILYEKAKLIAQKKIQSIGHSMQLEEQGISEEQNKNQEEQYIKELLEGNLKLLWNDENEI